VLQTWRWGEAAARGLRSRTITSAKDCDTLQSMSSKSYEHMILELDVATWRFVGEEDPHLVILENHGRRGWELVSTAPGAKEHHVLMFFKRTVKTHH
jgi:hypothetical protein